MTGIKMVFLLYSIFMFLISPFYIVRLIKKVKTPTGGVLILIGGTSIFLSVLFSLGIAMYQSKIFFLGFIICLIIGSVSVVLIQNTKQ